MCVCGGGGVSVLSPLCFVSCGVDCFAFVKCPGCWSGFVCRSVMSSQCHFLLARMFVGELVVCCVRNEPQ